MPSSPVAPSAHKSRGRPREFDEAAFLDAAITLFRHRSFSGVSISDITEATGLTAGSIYKAYTDKQGVFAKALERYIDQREMRLRERLEHVKDGKSRIAELLRDYVALSQGRDGKLGCMVVAGITDIEQLGVAADVLNQQLKKRLAALKALIAAGRDDGSIPADIDINATASVLLALLQGMRVVAKASTLTDDADAFMRRALRLLD
ncbi:TetR/AcrR family transcriptional regulator [Bordetella sp. N]|uniref:TetR/AcrR family transcriptional regulator n=1 Tax=Bordetella sp. N TaxID=1746199 RepID=UPI00070A21E2|nr:TetR/AcrR family transcriptional regulator [Bordetella sp. N]ALM83533.1 transcriptional regulator [Bordetella sp. N]